MFINKLLIYYTYKHFMQSAILKYTVRNNEINGFLYLIHTLFFHFTEYIERNQILPFWRGQDLKISRHAISAVIYPSIHSNEFVSSREVCWLTRLLTEALTVSMFQQSTRGNEIIDMPLYREFCGDVTQLEKPEFEGWQGSFAFTSQRCTIRNEKNKRVRMTRYIGVILIDVCIMTDLY